MKKMIMRTISTLLMFCLLASVVFIPSEVNAAAEYYATYSDLDKVTDYGSCTIMQGLAVGSRYMYSVKINGDDSQAVIFMTDKNDGSTQKLYNKDKSSYYFNYLGHANDMDVASFDGYSHLFVVTMTKGSNAVVRLKRSGTDLTKVASYSLRYNGSSISCSGIAIKSNSNGVITLILKSGTTVYTGSVSASATSATIDLSLLCTIEKSKVYLKDQFYDLSDFTNQGMGYHNGVMYVPITGTGSQINRSVIMVFNIDGIVPGSNIYPSEAIGFRITSSSYSALFEIESCGICSDDGRLYFNTNRGKTSSDKNHDGISWFKDYTYVKLTEPINYQNFVVQFDANGGKGTMANQVVNYGISSKLTANAYTRTGYKFVGWTAYRTAKNQWCYTNGTEKGWYTKGSQPAGYENYIYADQQSVSKTSSVHEDTVILYAQWEPITYTVKYDANGGTGTMADTVVTYGVNSTLRKNTFVREGYTFAGWVGYRAAQDQWRYVHPDGTGGWHQKGTEPEGSTLYVYGDGVNVSKTSSIDGDTTIFYAQWTAHSYTVTFRDEDGKVLQSTLVPIGTVPTAPTAPTKAPIGCTTYTFAGWDKDIVAVTGEATYTATYTEKSNHNWTDATCTVPVKCENCGTTSGEALGHTYKTYVTPPTCEGVGYTSYICVTCGNTLVTNEVPATGHSYDQGSCTVCGDKDPNYNPVVAPTISLQYPTLLLEDEIKMNVYFTLDQNIDLSKMGMLTWTAKPSFVDISTADAVIPGATFNSDLGYYGVTTEGIAAQNLGDVIYFCIYVELADGTIAYGKQVQYSPTTYAYNQLTGNAPAETKALYVSILNYGAAAQTFLNDSDPLVDANLTAAQKALVEEYRADMVHSVAMPNATKQGALAGNGGFSAKQPTISLDSAFAINYYFTPSATVKGNMTFYYWNAEDFAANSVLTTKNATGSMVMTMDGNRYGAAIDGIAAKDIDGALYACGVYTDANGNTYSTGILPYSLGFYCGNQLNANGDTAALAAAIAVYGYYAASYFSQK